MSAVVGNHKSRTGRIEKKNLEKKKKIKQKSKKCRTVDVCAALLDLTGIAPPSCERHGHIVAECFG